MGIKLLIKILEWLPEGTRSRSGSMIEAKKGVLLMQKLSKATVVPIGLAGTDMKKECLIIAEKER